MKELNREEVMRYSRHFNLAEVGLEGQRMLKNSSALLIGAGGLGSPLALYLAAAGVGRLGIVDFDVVDKTNLQRQILHGTSMLGEPKLDSARKRLSDLNPHIELELHETRLTSANAIELFSRYDVIADGADNFATRYLTNDAAVLCNKPLVSGSIQGFEGQLSVYHYKNGPCYRCLFPEPPPPGAVPSCAEGGVLGILPGVIGCLQATEVLKVLLGVGDVAAGRLVLYDALKLSFNSLQIQRDPTCAVCGEQPTVTELIDYADFCGVRPVPKVADISATDLHRRRDQFTLIDVRRSFERQICHIEPSLHVPEEDVAALPLERIPPGREVVVYCKTGIRAARAVEILNKRGVNGVYNLRGGIAAWIDQIDPSLWLY